MKKIVSVIIPIYNVENYLSECIESVRKQSYKNLEIILVNDGSTDNSLKICKKYAKMDERIRIINQKNSGLSAARNSGIEAAKGNYFFFLDSDDYIHSELINILVKIIENGENVDLVISNYSNEGLDYNNNGVQIWSQNGFWNNYYSSNYICCVVAWGKLYKSSLFRDNIRFPEGKIHEDEFILPKIIEKCKKIAFVDNPLYFYRIRKNSIMSSKNTNSYMDELDAFIERTDYFAYKNSPYFMGKAIDSVLFALWEIYSNCKYDKYLYSKNKVKMLLKRCKLGKIEILTKIKIAAFLLNDKLYFNAVTLKHK